MTSSIEIMHTLAQKTDRDLLDEIRDNPDEKIRDTARHAIFERYHKSVKSVAFKYAKRFGLENGTKEDIVSEATAALLRCIDKAIENYNPDYAFSTYISPWVNGAIRDEHFKLILVDKTVYKNRRTVLGALNAIKKHDDMVNKFEAAYKVFREQDLDTYEKAKAAEGTKITLLSAYHDDDSETDSIFERLPGKSYDHEAGELIKKITAPDFKENIIRNVSRQDPAREAIALFCYFNTSFSEDPRSKEYNEGIEACLEYVYGILPEDEKPEHIKVVREIISDVGREIAKALSPLKLRIITHRCANDKCRKERLFPYYITSGYGFTGEKKKLTETFFENENKQIEWQELQCGCGCGSKMKRLDYSLFDEVEENDIEAGWLKKFYFELNKNLSASIECNNAVPYANDILEAYVKRYGNDNRIEIVTMLNSFMEYGTGIKKIKDRKDLSICAKGLILNLLYDHASKSIEFPFEYIVSPKEPPIILTGKKTGASLKNIIERQRHEVEEAFFNEFCNVSDPVMGDIEFCTHHSASVKNPGWFVFFPESLRQIINEDKKPLTEDDRYIYYDHNYRNPALLLAVISYLHRNSTN